MLANRREPGVIGVISVRLGFWGENGAPVGRWFRWRTGKSAPLWAAVECYLHVNKVVGGGSDA